MTARRLRVNKKIALLRRILILSGKLYDLSQGSSVEEHLDYYQQWLQDAIAERESLPGKSPRSRTNHPGN